MVSIPQGGTIRNDITWESYLDSEETWYLHTLYGEKVGDVFNIYWSKSIACINHPPGTSSDAIDITIPIDATIDTYDAWTVISTTNTPSAIDETNIVAERFDDNVLNVVEGVYAEITSTSFSQLI